MLRAAQIEIEEAVADAANVIGLSNEKGKCYSKTFGNVCVLFKFHWSNSSGLFSLNLYINDLRFAHRFSIYQTPCLMIPEGYFLKQSILDLREALDPESTLTNLERASVIASALSLLYNGVRNLFANDSEIAGVVFSDTSNHFLIPLMYKNDLMSLREHQ